MHTGLDGAVGQLTPRCGVACHDTSLDIHTKPLSSGTGSCFRTCGESKQRLLTLAQSCAGEVYLLHGSKCDIVQRIVRHGFNHQLAGREGVGDSSLCQQLRAIVHPDIAEYSQISGSAGGTGAGTVFGCGTYSGEDLMGLWPVPASFSFGCNIALFPMVLRSGEFDEMRPPLSLLGCRPCEGHREG